MIKAIFRFCTYSETPLELEMTLLHLSWKFVSIVMFKIYHIQGKKHVGFFVVFSLNSKLKRRNTLPRYLIF